MEDSLHVLLESRKSAGGAGDTCMESSVDLHIYPPPRVSVAAHAQLRSVNHAGAGVISTRSSESCILPLRIATSRAVKPLRSRMLRSAPLRSRLRATLLASYRKQ